MFSKEHQESLKNILVSATVTGTSRALAAPLYMPLISLELQGQVHYGKTGQLLPYREIFKTYYQKPSSSPYKNLFNGTTAQAIRNFREYPRMFAWVYCDNIFTTALGLATADLVCNTVSDNIRNTMVLNNLRFVPAITYLSAEKGLIAGLLNKGSVSFVHSFAFWIAFKGCNDSLNKVFTNYGIDPKKDQKAQALICFLVGMGITGAMMPIENFRNRCTGKGADLRDYSLPQAAKKFTSQLFDSYRQRGLFYALNGCYRGGAMYGVTNIITAAVTILGLRVGEYYRNSNTPSK